jgi:hypothetical protein
MQIKTRIIINPATDFSSGSALVSYPHSMGREIPKKIRTLQDESQIMSSKLKPTKERQISQARAGRWK